MLTCRDFTFRVAFSKTVRASEQGWAGIPAGASEVSPSWDLSKPTTLFKSKFRSISRFGTFVLTYLTLVSHIPRYPSWSYDIALLDPYGPIFTPAHGLVHTDILQINLSNGLEMFVRCFLKIPLVR